MLNNVYDNMAGKSRSAVYIFCSYSISDSYILVANYICRAIFCTGKNLTYWKFHNNNLKKLVNLKKESKIDRYILISNYMYGIFFVQNAIN